MKISIPARKNTPATNLFVDSLVKNKLGERPVVFILPGGPGFDSSAYQSYKCLFELADIIFHDPRGCGQSDKTHPQCFTMENYIADIDIIRDFLKLDKIIILGKSYGSMVGLGYAIQYPAHTEKLILAAGAPSFRFLETAKRNLLRLGTPEQIQVCEKLWAGNFQNQAERIEFLTIMAPMYSHKAKANPDGFSLASASFSITASNLGFSDFLRKFDYEPFLSDITCQTLILAGEHDWINDPQHAKLMAEKIPNNQLIIFENSSHSMESDVTELYFSAIKSFISDQCARSSAG